MNTISKTTQHPITWTYFKRGGCRGIIFSLDAGISFTITLAMALIFATILAQNAASIENEIKNFELEENALFIADSLVKNYNENNTLLGSCVLDLEKKRVRTNEILLSNLSKAKAININEIYVESIFVKTSSLEKIFQLERELSINCINVKRFVLIDGEKGIIGVKTCTTEN